MSTNVAFTVQISSLTHFNDVKTCSITFGFVVVSTWDDEGNHTKLPSVILTNKIKFMRIKWYSRNFRLWSTIRQLISMSRGSHPGSRTVGRWTDSGHLDLFFFFFGVYIMMVAGVQLKMLFKYSFNVYWMYKFPGYLFIIVELGIATMMCGCW